jgi:hypothetical protein
MENRSLLILEDEVTLVNESQAGTSDFGLSNLKLSLEKE